MHPETRAIIEIDTDKEPTWMSKYLHRNSGLPFETGLELVASSIEKTPSVEPIDEVELTLEQIQAMYEEKTGKKAPARYKNDTEWLISKINE